MTDQEDLRSLSNDELRKRLEREHQDLLMRCKFDTRPAQRIRAEQERRRELADRIIAEMKQEGTRE
jgi:hypothetical protein